MTKSWLASAAATTSSVYSPRASVPLELISASSSRPRPLGSPTCNPMNAQAAWDEERGLGSGSSSRKAAHSPFSGPLHRLPRAHLLEAVDDA